MEYRSKNELERGITEYLAFCHRERTAARASELAVFLGIAYRTLRRVCNRVLGVPVSAAIRASQLKLAAHLLRKTDLPTGEIGILAGFGDRRTFLSRNPPEIRPLTIGRPAGWPIFPLDRHQEDAYPAIANQHILPGRYADTAFTRTCARRSMHRHFIGFCTQLSLPTSGRANLRSDPILNRSSSSLLRGAANMRFVTASKSNSIEIASDVTNSIKPIQRHKIQHRHDNLSGATPCCLSHLRSFQPLGYNPTGTACVAPIVTLMEKTMIISRSIAAGLVLVHVGVCVAQERPRSVPMPAAETQPWKLDLDARLELRFDPARRAARVTALSVTAPSGESIDVIDGATSPELLLPWELHRFMISTALNSDSRVAQAWRNLFTQTAPALSLNEQFWVSLEFASADYIRDLRQIAILTAKMRTATSTEAQSLRTEVATLDSRQCRKRMLALRAAQKAFEGDTFDRFLYLAVAPHVQISARDPIPAERHRAISGGCE